MYPSPDHAKADNLPIRVLWLTDKLGYGDELHGLGTYFLKVLPHVKGAEVTAACFRSSDRLLGIFRKAGVDVINLRKGKLNPLALFSLVHLIKKYDINLLHLHGFGASAFGRIVGPLLGVPVVIHQHDSMSAAPWYGRLCDRALARFTHRAIAVSSDVGEFLCRTRYIPWDRIHVLMNGIAPQTTESPEDLDNWRKGIGIQDDQKIIGTVARLRWEKGLDYLVRAFQLVRKDLPATRLVIFGDGEDRAKLERLSEELDVREFVYFCGFDPRAAAIIRNFDCFCLPSVSEGSPFALLEALVAEVPVIVTQVGGMKQIIRHGVNGLTVPPENVPELAAAIVSVLRDSGLSDQLRRGAALSSKEMSVEVHVSRLVKIYTRLLSSDNYQNWSEGTGG